MYLKPDSVALKLIRQTFTAEADEPIARALVPGKLGQLYPEQTIGDLIDVLAAAWDAYRWELKRPDS